MANVEKALEVQPKSVNGLKMILGAALVVLAGQLEVLNDLLPVLPSMSEQIQTLIGWINALVTALEWLLKIAGNSLISVGFLHKIWKLFSK